MIKLLRNGVSLTIPKNLQEVIGQNLLAECDGFARIPAKDEDQVRLLVLALRKKIMSQADVTELVNNIIKSNNLSAEIIEIENDDDTFLNVVVEVDRSDFVRASVVENFHGTYRISWQQKTPTLVHANVGDLVLIFNEREATDAESDVGLVSAKYIREDGSVYYGCRHIQISLNNMFVDDMDDFQLTYENYSGHPTGFLKILSQEELKEHLKQQLLLALDKELEAVNARFQRSTANLDKLISFLTNTKLIKSEHIELDKKDSYTIHVKV